MFHKQTYAFTTVKSNRRNVQEAVIKAKRKLAECIFQLQWSIAYLKEVAKGYITVMPTIHEATEF